MSIVNRSRIVRFAAGLLATAGLCAATGGAADAAPYAAAGTRGLYAINRPTCRNLPVWGQVQLSAPAPTIYSANVRAGMGNDYQLVRYRVFVVDIRTNQTVATSNYSGLAWAWDNSPAVFNGAPVSWNLSGGANQYRLDYRIEWLRPSDAVLVGWAAERVDSYTYYDGQVGPFSPGDRCMAVSLF